MRRTNVYVDGFNLYYGIGAADSLYKWLDIPKLCRLLLPGHDIKRVRYFTSIIEDRPANPGQVQRQLIFIRALESRGVDVHYGNFESRMECPRFGGHLSAGSVASGPVGRMGHHAKGIELQEAVSAGVSA